ncbi:MAG TPA: hypothetical protein VJ735_21815 [Actinomycetes bacterium]|nr:hypothetical protein [Actinomycetes bacterium]
MAAPHVDLEEAGVGVAPLAVVLDALGDGHAQVGDGDAGVGEADLGVLDQVADDGGVVVCCHGAAPCVCWFGLFSEASLVARLTGCANRLRARVRVSRGKVNIALLSSLAEVLRATPGRT